MNVNNPYNNNYQNQQVATTANTQQASQQGQYTSYNSVGGFYQPPNAQVQGITQNQPNLFPESQGYTNPNPGGVQQQTQAQVQPQPNLTNQAANNPYVSNYENPTSPMNYALTDAKVQAGLALNEHSNKQSIQRYMAVSSQAIRDLKREALDYKAL